MTVKEETRRHGDAETRGEGETLTLEIPASPRPRVPTSPRLSLLRQVWDKMFEDDVFGRAAQLSYYWLFSLFPLLIFLTALLAYLPIPSNLDLWFVGLSKVLPADAFNLVDQTFRQIISQRRSGLLSFSILVVIWASSSGMEAIIGSLNKAYKSATPRAWWRERLLAIGLTLGLGAFILSALTLIFFGESLGLRLSGYFGFGSLFETTWKLALWPLVSILILFGVDLIYYFAPNVRAEWRWFTPGAVFAVVCWLLISFGFRYYVSRFGNYNATYGALGGVMVLMLWFYLTGVVILVGGEINSVARK